MAGHSKWKNNLSRKTAQDRKRSSSFQKLSRAITVAVIEGGSPDPAFNPRLRVAIEKARADSMPKDNIERAVAKGSGPDKATLISLTYEIFGPGGSTLIVTATTDNANRTATEIRTLVDRGGGKIGAQGSVTPLYVHCAVVVLLSSQSEEGQERILELASELEALDIIEEDGHTIIYFPYTKLHISHDLLKGDDLSIVDEPVVTWRPLAPVTLSESDLTALESLIDALDEHDDVGEVYTNV